MRSAALALVLLAASAARAQIVLKPAAGEAARLVAKTLALDVTIRKGIAESKFDYTFANEGEWRGEADFLITVPENGVVTGFAYWYQGERVVARVAEKERAREIYRAITTRQRDPALIEMVDKRTFRVKVFPVEADADLRVELKMVQALPAGADGLRYVAPLKRLGRLESVRVDVHGEGPFATSVVGSAAPSLPYRSRNATSPDLGITAVRPKRPFVADLRAARSGGAEGFFALTLTAAGGMVRPRLSFSGVTVRSVMGLPARMVPGKAYTVVGRYANARPGARMFLAGRTDERFSESLDFSAAPEPNGPAAKLWAWTRIGHSHDRREIVALSKRHAVPSKFTSWIAIPAEERQRYRRQIAEATLQLASRRIATEIVRSGPRSIAARREIAAYRVQARRLNLHPSDVSNPELSEYAKNLSFWWTAEVRRHGARSAKARRLQSDLETLADLGSPTEEVGRFHADQAVALAPKVFADRLAGRRDVTALRRERELGRHVAHAGQARATANEYLETAEGFDTDTLAGEIARAEREDRPTSGEDRARLARREAALGRTPGRSLVRARGNLAFSAEQDLVALIGNELATEKPDEARLRELATRRERERAALRAAGYESANAIWALTYRARNAIADVREGKTSPEAIEAFRERLTGLARAAGESSAAAKRAFEDGLNEEMEDLRTRLNTERRMTTPDPNEIARLNACAERLTAIGGVLPPARPEDFTPSPLPDDEDGRPLTPTEARDRITQVRQAEELHARNGDPIVTFAAPAEAREMTAVMPDGTRIAMTWVARSGRWEARFDIPAGTPEGSFVVRIQGFVAGRRVAGRAEFRVDTTAPCVHVSRDGSRLVATTDPDVARVVALGADGSRREMVRSAPGRFALRDVLGPVRVVATDRAHNRSDMSAAPSLPPAGPIDPALNVQALARYGRRLWISTLDAGGRFEGGALVSEVGPWPRQATTFGDRLAVRSATGEIRVYDGGAWTMIERDATTLASEGPTLLVGIVGGWIERDGETRSVVRLPELAGRVVTCLLAQGDRLWIGTQGHGLYEWDRRTATGRWHDERQGFSDDWITALGLSASGRVVAGTFVGGAWIRVGAEWRPVPGTVGRCVMAIEGDRIATRQGVVRDGRTVISGEAQALAPGWIALRGRIESDTS